MFHLRKHLNNLMLVNLFFILFIIFNYYKNYLSHPTHIVHNVYTNLKLILQFSLYIYHFNAK